MFEAGLGIFFGVHIIPFVKKFKFFLQTKLGENLYKGLFSLISLLGLLLIIFGYETSSKFLYPPNETAYLYSKYLMFVSFTLLIAANMPTHIKKISKHPMSLGIGIWAVIHLSVSPHIDSIVLFGSFLIYSMISVGISELVKDSADKTLHPKISFDVVSVSLGVLFTFLVIHFHEYLSGTSLG